MATNFSKPHLSISQSNCWEPRKQKSLQSSQKKWHITYRNNDTNKSDFWSEITEDKIKGVKEGKKENLVTHYAVLSKNSLQIRRKK